MHGSNNVTDVCGRADWGIEYENEEKWVRLRLRSCARTPALCAPTEPSVGNFIFISNNSRRDENQDSRRVTLNVKPEVCDSNPIIYLTVKPAPKRHEM